MVKIQVNFLSDYPNLTPEGGRTVVVNQRYILGRCQVVCELTTSHGSVLDGRLHCRVVLNSRSC